MNKKMSQKKQRAVDLLVVTLDTYTKYMASGWPFETCDLRFVRHVCGDDDSTSGRVELIFSLNGQDIVHAVEFDAESLARTKNRQDWHDLIAATAKKVFGELTAQARALQAA